MTIDEVVRRVLRLSTTVSAVFARLDRLEQAIAILAKDSGNEELEDLVVQKDKEKEFKEFISNYVKKK